MCRSEAFRLFISEGRRRRTQWPRVVQSAPLHGRFLTKSRHPLAVSADSRPPCALAFQLRGDWIACLRARDRDKPIIDQHIKFAAVVLKVWSQLHPRR
jgi:hypothetical protein